MKMNQILDSISSAASLDELADILSDVETNDEILAAADSRRIELELEASVPTEAIKKYEARKASTASTAAAVLTPPADPLADKRALRADLIAKIAGCNDGDGLEALAPLLDMSTRADEYVMLRQEVTQAYKTKYKKVTGVMLKVAVLDTLFPTAAAKKGKVLSTLPLTEFGVTERFRRLYGKHLLFAVDVKSWYRFDNGYWQQEPSAVRVTELARQVIKQLRPEAEAIADLEERSKALKMIAGCERTQFASGVVAGLAGENGIAMTSFDLDTHPQLLAAPNGIVDLCTGALRPPAPEALLTMVTACDYVPDAKAPWFEKTVREVFQGNDEIISFFQRVMGYALMGDPVERIMVVPIGKGKNGKSTVFNAIQEVLGTHAAVMNSNVIASPVGALQAANAGGPAEHLLRLRGKRAIFGTELKRASIFNDDIFKSLASGGDKLVARGLHSTTSIEFKPTGVIIVPANVLAQVRDDDSAVWDRLVLLNFAARFDTPDTALPRKLQDEREGILSWLVQGALEYQRIGLAIPERVQNLKRNQREGASPIGLFIEDMCELGAENSVTVDDLFKAWQAHSFEQGVKNLAQEKISFGRYISANASIEGDRASLPGLGQKRIWTGIKLRETPNLELPQDFWQKRKNGS